MKAVVYREYGSPDVLQSRDVELPEPRPNDRQPAPMRRCRRVLAPRGRFVRVEGPSTNRWIGPFRIALNAWAITLVDRGHRWIVASKTSTAGDPATLAGLLKQRAFRPVIDWRYPLGTLSMPSVIWRKAMRAERSLSKSDLCPGSISGGGGDAAGLLHGANLDSRKNTGIPKVFSLFELLHDLQATMIRRGAEKTWRRGWNARDAER